MNILTIILKFGHLKQVPGCFCLNPLSDIAILGSSNSTANKDI